MLYLCPGTHIDGMPEIVCVFVWLIYSFYPFALSMRFLKPTKQKDSTDKKLPGLIIITKQEESITRLKLQRKKLIKSGVIYLHLLNLKVLNSINYSLQNFNFFCLP